MKNDISKEIRTLLEVNKMERIYKILLIGLLVLGLSSCNSNDADQNTISEISLEQKIGQMIMVGFRGTEVSENDDIYEMIDKFNLGGVVLYNRDLPSRDSLIRNVQSPEQLKQLNNDLQSISPTKLLIAIDEEGGLVSRLKPENGFHAHKSHQAIGEINNPDSTKNWADNMADELADLGINMNFAPAVDLNINPTSPVIGNIERSFSADPDIVITNSKIFMEAHKKKGIICVPKHFPGHGSAKNDSHKGLTDVTSTWEEIELIPYRELINDNYCDIVMTAHVYNEQLDSFPSTLSPKIISEILRGQLNFEGVIISDDMHMRAITNFYDLEESIEKAILSGVDILIFSNNAYPCAEEQKESGCVELPFDPQIAKKAIEHIEMLVNTGKIKQERINESYDRIIELKEKI